MAAASFSSRSSAISAGEVLCEASVSSFSALAASIADFASAMRTRSSAWRSRSSAARSCSCTPVMVSASIRPGEQQHALLGRAAGVADAGRLGVEQAAGALERGLLPGLAGDLEHAAADLQDELGHVRPPRSGA